MRIHIHYGKEVKLEPAFQIARTEEIHLLDIDKSIRYSTSLRSAAVSLLCSPLRLMMRFMVAVDGV